MAQTSLYPFSTHSKSSKVVQESIGSTVLAPVKLSLLWSFFFKLDKFRQKWEIFWLTLKSVWAISFLQESCQPFQLQFQPTHWWERRQVGTKHQHFLTYGVDFILSIHMEQRTEGEAERQEKNSTFQSRTRPALWGREIALNVFSFQFFSKAIYAQPYLTILQHGHCLDRTHRTF